MRACSVCSQATPLLTNWTPGARGLGRRLLARDARSVSHDSIMSSGVILENISPSCPFPWYTQIKFAWDGFSLGVTWLRCMHCIPRGYSSKILVEVRGMLLVTLNSVQTWMTSTTKNVASANTRVRLQKVYEILSDFRPKWFKKPTPFSAANAL